MMNMKKIIIARTIIVALVYLFVSSCGKDKETTSTLIVHLTDAPSAYNEVNVEVTGVEVHSNKEGWIQIPVADSIYNLLLLQDSANAVLDTTTIPAGIISQIRLILGSNNTLMKDSVVYPLLLSSEDESGLKLNIHQDLAAGQLYKIVLDFDAEKSIVDQGNGNYKLKPVITASFQ